MVTEAVHQFNVKEKTHPAGSPVPRDSWEEKADVYNTVYQGSEERHVVKRPDMQQLVQEPDTQLSL